ncbi:MAG TPA: hypothetical protein VG733_19320, partial [Chthoniobacteraceae bacterium]|nr:hypothetical protein [Phycisphaerae bacterium]HWB61642.1 hypothetical protein [Chthoniobacteraceae bacterium]
MHRSLSSVAVAAALLAATSAVRAAEKLDLSGTWAFSMDRDDTGLTKNFQTAALPDKIKLPGILQGQGYGDDISLDTSWVAALPRSDPDDPGRPFTLKRWWKLPEYAPYTKPGNIKVPYLSQPPKHYLGVAWYARDFNLGNDWNNQHVELILERPHWQTTVFVDGKQIGEPQRSLVAPHDYDLGILTPGKHHLAIRIDNRQSVFPGPNGTPGYRPDGHSVSDALGATWNGIAGKIELEGASPVYLDDVQVFPDAQKKTAHLVVKIGNATGDAGSGEIQVEGQSTPVSWDKSGGKAELDVSLPSDAKTWDEFHPNLQHLTVKLASADGKAKDSRKVEFGLRNVTHDGLKLLINGVQADLRGTHSGGDFPLTGYPATDVGSWKKIFATCKEYGLNAMRFHSYCPPDAAFQAADELGFYIQPECGMWNNFSVPGMPEMLEQETEKMEKAYGNHPSYIALSPSNEPAGNYQGVLLSWAAKWVQQDPRRLYAEDTGRSNLRAQGPTFGISPIRGSQGWFGRNYSRQLQGVNIPVVTHEMGQWCAYPDFDLIKKFTGYLQPGNYEIFRDSAKAHGVLDRDKEFSFASGKFQVACYKEDIEANLRTPELSGFELLDLHDYLGQGGALIGILDTFWQSKGYETPKEWREFCSQIVPLAAVSDRVYRSSDKLEAPVMVAQFGPKDLKNVDVDWHVENLDGKKFTQGTLGKHDLPIGKDGDLGTISIDLHDLPAPAQYRLVLDLPGTDAKNSWNFWLYPDQVSADNGDVLVTSDWAAAKDKLAAGGKVLFSPPPGALDDTSPPLDNVPVFWNRLMNPKLSAMLGLWVDAKNPALTEFPTEGWCDFQWTQILVHRGTAASGRPMQEGVRPVNIEKAPKELKPIVSAIDDWARNYKLGLIFEVKVGSGRLMVSGVNLTGDLDQSTVARQLRHSLVDYMNTDKFNPAVAMTPDQADALWPGKNGVHAGPIAPGANPGDIREGPAAAPRTR